MSGKNTQIYFDRLLLWISGRKSTESTTQQKLNHTLQFNSSIQNPTQVSEEMSSERRLTVHYMLDAIIQSDLHTQYCGQSPQEQFGVKCLSQGHNDMLTAVGFEPVLP